MASEPAWKRLMGGLCGIAIAVAVLLLLRQRDVSGDAMQQWETVFVLAAGAVAVVLWIIKRRSRRQP